MTKTKTTAQAVFERVARAMLAQGRRAADAECGRYAHGNLRCAVGLLLTSNDVSGVEGLSVLDSKVQDLLPFDVTDEVIGVLDYLQRLHDRVEPSDWERGLSIVADLTGLEMPSLKTAAVA